VAHVLLEKVIPWSCLYDRLYDENQQMDEAGHPVSHEVCLASLPDAQGNLRGGPCGSLPGCPLHPDHVSARLAADRPVPIEKTVVCPRSFWGFKHVIEIPAQQASVVAGAADPTAGRRPPDIRDKVLRGAGSTQLLAGINEHCRLVTPHLTELDDVVARSAPTATWRAKVTRRDPMLVALQSRDLDVIYFYCHARGGLADPSVKPPCLELHDLTVVAPERINATHLYYKGAWDHYPLVILNGCGTAGFSPDALSPFVIRFVRDRGAAGVLGTEIPVWEQLATAVARDFLRRFLAGEGAGPALLAVRRQLLAERNPLGLLYTLYAPAELALQLA
jgi:CHAT domain-containing protein